jgi:hypothetical protein
MTPTEEVLKAIVNLKEHKQWSDFITWLEFERLDAAVAACHTGDDVASRWVQGHEQLLEMLLDVIKNAEDALKSIKTARDNVNNISGVF